MVQLKSLLILFFIFSSGCVSLPQLSPQQKRALQTKVFRNTDYNDVFRAFKSVLQDEGYIIKNQDFQGGLLVAEIEKSSGAIPGVIFFLGGTDDSYPTGTEFTLSVNLEKINSKTTEARTIVQEKVRYNRGGVHGRQILTPEIYKSLYNKVEVEIRRRQARN